jgi:DNA polymerase III delta' subunit
MHSTYQSQWDYLLKRFQQNQLPHALLLSGEASIDKTTFAIQFAKMVLCEQHTLCGSCRQCQLMQAGNHPDFYHVQPEAEGKSIRVDQIRELIAQLNQTAQQNAYKIAIIAPADALNLAAANAILKTLEEPSAQTLIFLVTNHASLLPATIRSRCQSIKFFPDDQQTILTEQQEKLLLDINAISEKKIDPVQIAARWVKTDIQQVIEDLLIIIMDKIRHQSRKQLFDFLDALYLAKRQTLASNLNQQLLLENLFFQWKVLC